MCGRCPVFNKLPHYCAAQGGAIAAILSTVTVMNSTFEANFAELGGAVATSYNSRVNTLDVTFIGNVAGRR